MTDLVGLGGTADNPAFAIDNRGQAIGWSYLSGDLTKHGFLWNENVGMTDLGTLPGDFSSAAWSIDNKGRVVGTSCDASGNCRAFLWQHGVIVFGPQLSHPRRLPLVFGGGERDRFQEERLPVQPSMRAQVNSMLSWRPRKSANLAPNVTHSPRRVPTWQGRSLCCRTPAGSLRTDKAAAWSWTDEAAVSILRKWQSPTL